MLEQLVAQGTRYIFGNPGTTEQAFMDALQDFPQLEYILALHEGVATGIADGYARATGAPAFLIRLWESGDVWKATRFANCAASFAVEGEGIATVPTREQVEARLKEHPEITAR